VLVLRPGRERKQLSRLGDHPQVAVCGDCTHGLHGRAQAAPDVSSRSLSARSCGIVVSARDLVMRKGWQQVSVIGPLLRRFNRHPPWAGRRLELEVAARVEFPDGRLGKSMHAMTLCAGAGPPAGGRRHSQCSGFVGEERRARVCLLGCAGKPRGWWLLAQPRPSVTTRRCSSVVRVWIWRVSWVLVFSSSSDSTKSWSAFACWKAA